MSEAMYEPERCIYCKKTAFHDVSGISRIMNYCDRCDEPACGDCADCDYDMVGDPPSYKCTQWVCKTKCERNEAEMKAIRIPGITDPSLSAEEKMLYDAILDCFDSSDPDAPRFFFEGHGIKCAGGGFDTVSEDMANGERLDFARAVISRLRSLKGADSDDPERNLMKAVA